MRETRVAAREVLVELGFRCVERGAREPLELNWYRAEVHSWER